MKKLHWSPRSRPQITKVVTETDRSSSQINSGHFKLVAVVGAGALVLASCASIPETSSPVPISSYEAANPSPAASAPQPGREPDLLVRDFLEASAVPTGRHATARQYLTEPAAGSWDDTAITVIETGAEISTAGPRIGDSVSFIVRGNRAGTLENGGAFSPEDGLTEVKLTLVRINGDWRIDQLPDGVVLERASFEKVYQQHTLYFFGSSGRNLIPDVRWLASERSILAPALIDLLTQGPRKELADMAFSEIDADTVLASVQDGELERTEDGDLVVDFRGLGALDSPRLQRLAAQVIWTLTTAQILGPYEMRINGELINQDTPRWTTTEVKDYDPDAIAGVEVPLHAVRDGGLVKVTESGPERVNSSLGRRSDLTSATISRDGNKVAAVAKESEAHSELQLSLLEEGESSTAITGHSLSRPTWDRDSASVWTVVDGNSLMRLAPSGASSQVVVSEVDTSAVRGIGRVISEARIAPSGGRMALIVDGRVVVVSIVERAPGSFAVVEPQDVAPLIAGQALSLDWRGNDQIIVGTSTRQAPIVAAWIDGSRLDSITGANISPPVIVVSGSPGTQYVLDRRGLMQLAIANDSEQSYWREVPGMNGISAAPVLTG